MFDLLIKAVFWIIGKIGDIILTPIILVINTLLPNVNINFNAIFDYLEMGFQYIPFFLKSFLIPPGLIQLMVIILTATISIVTGIRAYRFIMKLYSKFKP